MKFNKKTELAAEQQLNNLINGQVDDLESTCSQFLKKRKGHPYFYLCLAVLRYAAEQSSEADELFQKAFTAAKGDFLTLYNMSIPLVTYGITHWATRVLERAIELSPESPQAHQHLGLVQMQTGKLAEAEKSFQAAIEQQKDWFDPLFNLGVACHRQKRYLQALRSYRAALELNPDDSDCHYNLGGLLMQLGRYDVAATHFDKALKLSPANIDTIASFTRCLIYLGNLEKALEVAETACRNKQNSARLRNNLGMAYSACRREEEALEAFQLAAKLDPEDVTIKNNTVGTLVRLGRIHDAFALQEKIEEQFPDDLRTIQIKSELYAQAGNTDSAIEYLKAQMERGIYSTGLHSELIFLMLHSGHCNFEEVTAEAIKWAQKVPAPANGLPAPDNDTTPDRQIRIGYVSPDFKNHALTRHFEGFLKHHDHERFHFTAYAHLEQADEVTRRLEGRFDQFRFITRLTDEELAAVVRTDKIDILIDLAGHTANNRLAAFKYRPAPVQVSWLGFPCTSGLEEMDYYLTTDAHNTPENQKFFTENLAFLRSFTSYTLPEELPEEATQLAPPPACQSGSIVFGCYNRPHKITDEMVQTWGRVLQQLPDAKLLLKNHLYGDEASCEEIRSRYAKLGVPVERLILEAESPLETYFKSYNNIDIGLDTAPFNGSTISLDMLYMGVPFITLKGDTDVSIQGANVLNTVGLPDLIAANADEYVQKAVSLAHDLPRLEELRQSLRDELVKKSQSTEAVRDLEDMYVHLWKKHCAGEPPSMIMLEERYSEK